MKKVILDCDPGVDDALAIMYLIEGKAELLAVTTVAGNHEVGQTTLNALKVIEALGMEKIPVYEGAPGPLTRELVTAIHVHGVDGLGDSGLPKPKLTPKRERASNFLARFIDENEERVTLLATGPLTNLALALRERPWIVKKISETVIMGGTYFLTPFGYGNVTRVSEFNFYVDPEAAYFVLNSGLKPKLVGLDVTQDPGTSITPSLFQHLGRLSKRILKNPLRKFGLFHLHDPMAAAMALHPEMFRTLQANVSIGMYDGEERGICLVDRRGLNAANSEIAYKVNRREFLRSFLDLLSKV